MNTEYKIGLISLLVYYLLTINLIGSVMVGLVITLISIFIIKKFDKEVIK